MTWDTWDLLTAEKLLMSNIAWKMGIGHTILVSKHKWVQGATLLLMDDIMLAQSANLRAHHLLDPLNNQWNCSTIHALFKKESAWNMLELLASGSPTYTLYQSHTRYWGFLTKSTSHVLLQ